MVAYNFQAQFADAVERGTKRQTIRRRRKRPTVVGDVLQHYTGLRTRAARKLCDAVCREIDRFEIYEERARTFGREYFGGQNRGSPVCSETTRLVVSVNGLPLSPLDIRALAIADGFSRAEEFLNFFIDHYGLPFSDGEIIKW